ncbi:MAG TPA: DNA-processing protein DprA [Candidatus Cloacimonetes bacterium]|nr:DNA-processing protein DprA [Candidatus Cloacimonadota bacterium]
MQHAAYWITISHLQRWTNAKINDLIKKIYIDNGADLESFFSLSVSDWENDYSLDERQLLSLSEAKEQVANNAFVAESLIHQGYELIPLISEEYPPTMKENLKMNYSPPLLYVKGNKQLLMEDSVAIVGSRKASSNGMKFTENVAKHATQNYQVVVSGFAKGIDRAALDFAMKYTGQSIIVLPQGITTFASGFKTYYQHIIRGDVLVLSAFHPKAPWSVGLAMARNPIIYGLANHIYVADSSNTGGTWEGVKDGLKKGRTIYIRKPEIEEDSANADLIDMGGTAVDMYGKPISHEKMKSEVNKQKEILEGLSENIVDILAEKALTAKEICTSLNTDISYQKMSVLLKNIDDVEKVKVGRSTKYRVKIPDIFDLQVSQN